MSRLNVKLVPALGVVGIVMFATAAQAAPLTLDVTAAPANGGSSASRAGHVLTTKVSHIAEGSDGNPKVALTTLTESFPAEFQTNFGSYGTCPDATVVHQDNKPNCPDNSLLGHVEAFAYVPALHTTAQTDGGYIWKTGPTTVASWSHVSKPAQTSAVIKGVITNGSSPFGPVITWDTSNLASGAEAGVEIRVSSIKFTWDSGTTGSSADDSSAARAKKFRACNARAKKIKNGRKRKGAVARCKRKYGPRPATPRASAPTSPFVSIGCPGGSWPFHDDLTFADKSTATADKKVSCQ